MPPIGSLTALMLKTRFICWRGMVPCWLLTGLNQHQAPNELTITVVCEQGTVRWELPQNRWRWMVNPDEPWHDEQYEQLPRDAIFTRQANAFLDLVEGRVPPLCSLEEGVQSLRVNLAALASVEQESWQIVRTEKA